MVKGKTLDEALAVSNQDIAEFLGGLPEEKMHCSVMGQEALEVAIYKHRGLDIPEHDAEHDHGHAYPDYEGTIVCKCFGITDTFIKKVIETNKLTTAEQVTHFTKAGGACGGCIPKIKELIAEVLGQQTAQPQPKTGKLSNLKKMQLVQEVLERDIRPMLMADGGDLELVDIEGDNVQIAFRKACAGCASSGNTARFVEMKLRELVHDDLRVQEVAA
jgi:NifU-like protein